MLLTGWLGLGQVGLEPEVLTHWVTTTSFMGFHPIPRSRASLGATSALLGAPTPPRRSGRLPRGQPAGNHTRPVVLAEPYVLNALCLECLSSWMLFVLGMPFVLGVPCLGGPRVPLAPNAGGEPPRHVRTAAWVQTTICAVGCRVEPVVTHPAPPQTRTCAIHAYGSSCRATAALHSPLACCYQGW